MAHHEGVQAWVRSYACSLCSVYISVQPRYSERESREIFSPSMHSQRSDPHFVYRSKYTPLTPQDEGGQRGQAYEQVDC